MTDLLPHPFLTHARARAHFRNPCAATRLLGERTTSPLRASLRTSHPIPPPTRTSACVAYIGLTQPVHATPSPPRCAELVHDELVRIAAQCESSQGELRRFTGLRQRVNDVVADFLRRCAAVLWSPLFALWHAVFTRLHSSLDFHTMGIGSKRRVC